ncbi:MAG: hypothetical protein QME51_09960, partial [Planctomycetota bacterium]|nr:hypothetical protein [Planctomycetota bacterium]
MNKLTIKVEGSNSLLGRIAISNKLITSEQLQKALALQETYKRQGKTKPLGAILVEQNYLNKEQLHSILQFQSKVATREDDLFYGNIALRNDFVTQSQLDECLALQRERGKTARLGEILLEKNYITIPEHESVLSAQKRLQADYLQTSMLYEFSHDLKTDEITIGSLATNDLQISTAEPMHCKLKKTDPGYQIVNLVPAHPLRVNGMEVTSYNLQPGDRIEIGKTTIIYKSVPESPKSVLPAVPVPIQPPLRKSALSIYQRRKWKFQRKPQSIFTPVAIAAGLLLALGIGIIYFNQTTDKQKTSDRTEVSKPLGAESTELSPIPVLRRGQDEASDKTATKVTPLSTPERHQDDLSLSSLTKRQPIPSPQGKVIPPKIEKTAEITRPKVPVLSHKILTSEETKELLGQLKSSDPTTRNKAFEELLKASRDVQKQTTQYLLTQREDLIRQMRGNPSSYNLTELQLLSIELHQKR